MFNVYKADKAAGDKIRDLKKKNSLQRRNSCMKTKNEEMAIKYRSRVGNFIKKMMLDPQN